MRAQQFLLSYARFVFSEDDLSRMKRESLSVDAGSILLADMLMMSHETEE